jgi:thioredoxin 1
MNILIIVFIVLATVIGYLIYQYRRIKNMPVVSDSKFVVTLTDANYMSKLSRGVVMIDFWAPWCMPCKMIGPVINEIAEEFEGKATIGKLNVDENPRAAQSFGVRSIPTIIVFKNGKEVERIVGVKGKPVLIQALKKHL